MCRIGKKPVELPSGVSATVSGQTVEVKGPKGTRSFTATDDVTITLEDNIIKVDPRGKSKRARQQWGMSRTMVALAPLATLWEMTSRERVSLDVGVVTPVRGT